MQNFLNSVPPPPPHTMDNVLVLFGKNTNWGFFFENISLRKEDSLQISGKVQRSANCKELHSYAMPISCFGLEFSGMGYL